VSACVLHPECQGFGLPPTGVATRVVHALIREGYRTPHDMALANLTDWDVSDMPGIGLAGLRLLEQSTLPIQWHYVEKDGAMVGLTGVPLPPDRQRGDRHDRMLAMRNAKRRKRATRP